MRIKADFLKKVLISTIALSMPGSPIAIGSRQREMLE
jgi:hypothetical protein